MIRIGTRGSELALWQANHIARQIGIDKTEIIVLKTKGDRIQNVSFDKIEGKGFFTKEIEDALLNGQIDVAVHSMKDLPTDYVPGLKIAAVPEREDPADIMLIRKEACNPDNVLHLCDGADVGTSSLRRVSQLRYIMDSVHVHPLRGNVPTRVRRLREGRFDAIIVARAGLMRLNVDLNELETFILPYDCFLPAPAQGALALQIREEDIELGAELKGLTHIDTELTVGAERSFLNKFGGGCHIPLGALAEIEEKRIRLTGVVVSVDGRKSVRKTVVGEEPLKTGEMLADLMKDEGADKLI